jgi:hypothetical protein
MVHVKRHTGTLIAATTVQALNLTNMNDYKYYRVVVSRGLRITRLGL